MQTAQLTFNDRIVYTEFFPVLFFFRCGEKDQTPPKRPRYVICWDLFLYFWGHFDIKNYASMLYHAKISAIRYLFGYFSLLFRALMGVTERPRYTGFRGLSVRGITAPQCILERAIKPIVKKGKEKEVYIQFNLFT